MTKSRFWMPTLVIMAVVVAGLALNAGAAMKEPEMVTISGVLADYSCASKGQAMMGNWHNATHDDHMTPEGEKPGCATMCLKALGQPAALFDTGKEKISAVFACNPSHTLAGYAAKEVEVTGFWAGKGTSNAFVPAKIRGAGGGDWEEVVCAQMHGEM